MTKILENAGTGIESEEQIHHGGTVQLQLAGAFDGAIVEIQVSQDGLPYTTLLQDNPFDAPDVNDIAFTKGTRWKLAVVGGTAPSITASYLI